MKKSHLLLFVSVVALFIACTSSNPDAQTAPTVETALDSAQEQKNLDSLFNAAGKNVSGAKDSAEKK